MEAGALRKDPVRLEEEALLFSDESDGTWLVSLLLDPELSTFSGVSGVVAAVFPCCLCTNELFSLEDGKLFMDDPDDTLSRLADTVVSRDMLLTCREDVGGIRDSTKAAFLVECNASFVRLVDEAVSSDEMEVGVFITVVAKGRLAVCGV